MSTRVRASKSNPQGILIDAINLQPEVNAEMILFLHRTILAGHDQELLDPTTISPAVYFAVSVAEYDLAALLIAIGFGVNEAEAQSQETALIAAACTQYPDQIYYIFYRSPHVTYLLFPGLAYRRSCTVSTDVDPGRPQ